MTRLPGLDPETLDDLRRSNASLGDSTRSRRARNPWADAARVEHVEHWPCRGGCGRMIGVTQEAVTALAVMNAKLVTDGERPIAKQHAVPCPSCKAREDAEEAARRRPHEQLGFEQRPTTAGKGRP